MKQLACFARTRTCALVLLAVGCGKDPVPEAPPTTPAAVVVTPKKLTLRAGNSAQLSAQSNDASGQPIGGAPLAFASRNPGLLTVSPYGLVTSVGPVGTDAVTVTSGPRSARVLVTIVPDQPASIEKESGDGQSTAVTKVLADAVVVKVVDSQGNPTGGSTVTFVASGGGAAAPSIVHADAQGFAKTYWTLGKAAGVQTLTASSPGLLNSPLTFTAVGVAGPPAKLALGRPLPVRVLSGDVIKVAARVTDEHANGSPGVAVTFTAGKGAGSVTPESVTTDAAGLATATWTPDKKALPQELTAQVASVAGPPLVFRVLPAAGPPARVEIVGEIDAGRAGRALAQPLAVKVFDAHGNPVAGAAVTLTTNEGGKVEPGHLVTAADGAAALRSWKLAGPGANRLEARAGAASATLLVPAAGVLAFAESKRAPLRLIGVGAVVPGPLEGVLRADRTREAVTKGCALLGDSHKGAVVVAGLSPDCSLAERIKGATTAGVAALIAYPTDTAQLEKPAPVSGALPVFLARRRDGRALASELEAAKVAPKVVIRSDDKASSP